MKRKQLLSMIEEGENGQVEFKRKFSSEEKIAREMIALANTTGGFILFGVDDNGTVVGVESEKGEAELIKVAAEQYCEPPVTCKLHYFEFKGYKEVVVAEIPQSETKPHRIQDYQDDLDINAAQVYIRVGEKSVQANKEMIRVLRAEGQREPLYKYTLGKLEQKVFDWLESHETISVKELCQLANISERRASRTLVKMVRASLIFIHTKDNGENYFTASG